MTISDYIAERSIPEPNSGCHLWLNSSDKDGYGWAHWQGRTRKAHRLAWEAARGPIPGNLCVCHKCDNPGCVNVEHKWLGTNEENTADRVVKGRSNVARGEAQYAAVLTEADVLAIRASTASGRDLAREYKVTFQTISDVRRGRRWAHLDCTAAVPSGAARGERSGTAKLTEDEVRAIRASKDTNRDLAEAYGIAPAYVWQVRNRKTWKHVE